MNWNDYFSYDSETGILSWKVKRPGPKTAIGMEAGSIKHDGRYRSFVIFHKRYYTHRIIWEMLNGPIQDGMCIDHIDGNGLNNHIENLRVTTLSGNQRNRRIAKNNRTGVPGLIKHKNGYSVTCAGKYIGYFQTKDAATKARKKAEIERGYHENNGRAKNAST